MGFYVTKFKYDNPLVYQELTMYKTKLNIDDVSLSVHIGIDQQTGKPYKELIIGFKTININTYTVCV